MDEFIKFGGWLVGLLGAIGTLWATSRKVKVDETSLALNAWKEMTERHENEIANLLAREKDTDLERQALRDKLKEVEDQCYEERQQFRRTIEGLQTQTLQLHTSYLAQMTLLADPTNPDHAKLLQRASDLIEHVRKASS